MNDAALNDAALNDAVLNDAALNYAILLGYDDWLDRHEDAVDLYLDYRRLRFDTLAQALAYTYAQLPLRPEELRAAARRR